MTDARMPSYPWTSADWTPRVTEKAAGGPEFPIFVVFHPPSGRTYVGHSKKYKTTEAFARNRFTCAYAQRRTDSLSVWLREACPTRGGAEMNIRVAVHTLVRASSEDASTRELNEEKSKIMDEIGPSGLLVNHWKAPRPHPKATAEDLGHPESVRHVLVFDTETTGFPHERDSLEERRAYGPHNTNRLVQLGCVLYDRLGEEVEAYECIVKPNGYVIPKVAARLHGITQDRATREGVSLEEALKEFMRLLEASDRIVAHNKSYDIRIIREELERVKAPGEVVARLAAKESYCTMRVGRRVYHKPPTLSELYKHFFEESFEGQHTALADARACGRCYFKCVAVVGKPRP